VSEYGVEVSTERTSDCLFESVKHPETIFIVNQAITKHSQDLVCPDPDAHVCVGDLVLARHANAANDLAEVTQVEGVVTLHRSWLQVILNLLVHLHSGADQLALHGRDVGTEVESSEIPPQNCLEDAVHGIFIEYGKGDNVEVTLESGGDEGLATAWGSHSGDDHGVNDVAERVLVVLSFVPPVLIDELAEDFDGGLSAVVLFLWHVQVVYEDYATHTKLRAEVIFPTFVQLSINDVLNLY
jgi:hypothetical protein